MQRDARSGQSLLEALSNTLRKAIDPQSPLGCIAVGRSHARIQQIPTLIFPLTPGCEDFNGLDGMTIFSVQTLISPRL